MTNSKPTPRNQCEHYPTNDWRSRCTSEAICRLTVPATSHVGSKHCWEHAGLVLNEYRKWPEIADNWNATPIDEYGRAVVRIISPALTLVSIGRRRCNQCGNCWRPETTNPTTCPACQSPEWALTGPASVS